MSFFSGLNEEQYDRQYSDRDLTRRIVAYFRPQTRRLAIAATLMLLTSLLGAVQPVVASRGVDLLRNEPGSPRMYLIPLAVFLIGGISWLASYVRRRVATRAIADVVLDLRSQAFGAAARHDLSFYDQFSSGRIVSRITSDTQDFGQLVVLISDVAAQFVESFVLAVILLNTEWRLALYVFAIMPVVFGLALSYRHLARRVTRRGMQAMANVNAAIKETVSGIAIAKNFRQEASVYAEFDDANRRSYSVNLRRGLTLGVVFPVLNTLSGLMTALLVYTGGLSVSAGLVTAGAWYLFLLSLDYFMYPMMNLSAFWTQVQSGLSAAERVFALIDATPVVVQREARPAPVLKGRIQFENVGFRYAEHEPVLVDFSLDIRPGETLALVGHTGAGKSSIAKLIARFYEFQQGRILVDGLDIRTLELASYRRQLGVVSQMPFLFSGSVLENIRYANPDASQAEIERIAGQIGGGEWLETLPQGLQTEVGERGGRLSMGQRQLVSLMRVLVQRPAIFVLDEATASIDPFTEWQIQQALDLILKNATSILIAHRLSTVRAADRIIVIEQGRILEQGDHRGLLAQGGHYATLYNTYFRHQSLDYRPAGLDEFLQERQPAKAV